VRTMMRRKPASQFKDRCKGAKLGERRSFAFLLEGGCSERVR
jgi:hypothetical protein